MKTVIWKEAGQAVRDLGWLANIKQKWLCVRVWVSKPAHALCIGCDCVNAIDWRACVRACAFAAPLGRLVAFSKYAHQWQADFVSLCKLSRCFSALTIEEGEMSREKHYSYNTLYKLWKLWELPPFLLKVVLIRFHGSWCFRVLTNGVCASVSGCVCVRACVYHACVCFAGTCVYLVSEWMCSVVGRHVACITHQRKVRLKHRVGLKVRARLYIEQREGWGLSKLSLGERLLEVTKPLTWRTDLMS